MILLLLLSSTGLTFVVEVCCDSPDSEESDSISLKENAGCLHSSTLADDATRVTAFADCHRFVLAGGLNDLAAIVQMDPLTGTTKGMALRIADGRSTVLSNTRTFTLHGFFFFTNGSPPSVDRYILTLALLI